MSSYRKTKAAKNLKRFGHKLTGQTQKFTGTFFAPKRVDFCACVDTAPTQRIDHHGMGN